MSLKIIGAGLGRTGTLSLKAALEQIGFRKCYHMVDVFQKPDDVVYWEAARDRRPVPWDRVFDGYQATVDYPGCLYYRELMKKYPDAKVLLTVRSAESWYESARNTIMQPQEPTRLQKLTTMVQLPFSSELRYRMRVMRMISQFWEEVYEGRVDDRAYMIEAFHRHTEEVKAAVPKERLLVFEVKQGWGPLCEFLGVPVPEGPFPRLNDREEFQRRRKLGIRAMKEALKNELANRG